MHSTTMRVSKYLPERLFGFVINDAGLEVYFQRGKFDPGTHQTATPTPVCSACRGCSWATLAPGPLPGERVRVELSFDPADPPVGERAPRASRVLRLNPPTLVQGVVESFDVHRGYGFVRGEDGLSYHLHRSEVLDGYLPVKDNLVRFFAGSRQARPRACYVKTCPE